MLPNSFIKSCHELLEDGGHELDLLVGIVSHIFSDNYQIVAINSIAGAGSLREGALFPLQDTYCRDVITSKRTIALTEIAGAPGMQKHPLYVKMPLEAYISAPIFYKGDIWGTVNFTSIKAHKAFTKEDIKLVESYAQRIQKMLIEIDAPKRRTLRE